MRTRHSFVGRCSSGALGLASIAGALFVAACSQAPAFDTQLQVEPRVGGMEGEADANAAVRSACATEAVAHSECRAVGGAGEGLPEGSGMGGLPDGGNGAPGSEYGGVPGSESPGDRLGGEMGSERPGTPGDGSGADGVVSNPVPTPVATPIASNPTPVPTPVGPKAGDWREQVIAQPSQGKVDILWVIDNSGSMKWAQEALASKFENFARELTKFSVDFRVGVTTTNVCRTDGKLDEFCPDQGHLSTGAGQRGELVKSNGSLFLSNTPDFVSRFGALAMRGTTGSGLEQGLSAAKFAIEKSAPGGANAGFVRSDAQLSVIVLSDEEDDGVQIWEEDAYGNKGIKDYWGNPSYAIDPTYVAKFNFANQKMTTEKFMTSMDSLKGAGKYQVSAITGIRGTDGNTFCYKDSQGKAFGPMEAGTNYVKAASKTGGVAENICGNWQSILTNLGRSTVELTTRISLAAEPYPGTLEVYVNGTLWATGWEYDAQAKVVVFKTVPPYGAQVVVRYRETIR